MTLLGGPFYFLLETMGRDQGQNSPENVVEDIEQADGERVQKLRFILGIGNGKLEEIISYNQLVDHLEAAANDDNEISDDLFKFRALIGHQGPLKPTGPNWKGCKYNVLVDWETGEKTYEPSQSWQQMIT